MPDNAPTKILLPKLIYHGFGQLITRKINAGQTGYDGLPVIWEGNIDFEFTPSQEKTSLPAGDDPNWGTIDGPVLGNVKLTVYSIPVDVAPQLLAVKYSAADGLIVGDDDAPTVNVGLSVENSVKNESTGAVSKNKTIIYKVNFDLPTKSIKTKQEGDNAVATIELNGKAYPAFFTKTNGSIGRRTYCSINSNLNSVKYAANADTIVWPTDFTADSAQE